MVHSILRLTLFQGPQTLKFAISCSINCVFNDFLYVHMKIFNRLCGVQNLKETEHCMILLACVHSNTNFYPVSIFFNTNNIKAKKI